MKLQDKFPYDGSLLSLEGKYQPLGEDGFLINSKCIMVKQHIVSTGSTYFFFEHDDQKNVTATACKLIDVFFHFDYIYLLIIDLFNGQVQLVNTILDDRLSTGKWKLVDTNSVETMLDAKEKKSSGNELLEFQF